MISNEKEFWTVGYSQWGRWQVRKASVDQPDKYTLVEDLGPELKAAYLEADGDFVYKAGEEHISLITVGTPWLFVITTSGKLYVKKVGAPLDTALLLDTGVIQASTCRGWKSEQYSVDSGLIVAYRKAVGVYLREYYRVNGVYTWNPIQTVVSTAANGVEVKRLNDFRIGIRVDDVLLLTNRYYIGGTTKTEFVNANINTEFNVLSITNVDGPKADFVIQDVTLVDTIEFWIRGNYPFYSIDPTWHDISITTSVGAGQGIEYYTVADGFLKIRMKQPITTALAYMSFKLRRANRIRFIRTEQSKPICPELTIIYQAPPYQYSEVVAVNPGVSGISLIMKQKRLLTAEYQDHVSIAMTASIALSIAEVTRKSASNQEIVSTAVQASASLSMEMSGTTPV